MVKCAYNKCLEQMRNFRSTSFFQVPNDFRRLIWLKHASVASDPNITLYFCEKHFHNTDIKIVHMKSLHKFALPKSSPIICGCSEKNIDASCVRVMHEFIMNTASSSQPEPGEPEPKRNNFKTNNFDMMFNSSSDESEEQFEASEVPHYLIMPFLSINLDVLRKYKETFFKRKLVENYWGDGCTMKTLTLFYTSPGAYNFLPNKLENFPQVKTLYKWHSQLHLSAGISDQVMIYLRIIAETESPLGKKCVLAFDEIAINPKLEYSFNDDMIYGFQDFGVFGRSNKIASKMLVFCLRGLAAAWKLTIGYFVGSPDGDTLSKMIVSVVRTIYSCGLEVVATCCDQSTNNIQAYTKLLEGSNGPWVDIDSHRIYLLFDVPHLFKSMRNVLMENRIYIENELIDCNFLEKIFASDESEPDGHHLLRFIKREHIFLDDFQKLSVGKALHVFGKEIDFAMRIAANFKKWDNIKPTAIFITKLHELLENLYEEKLYSKRHYENEYEESERIFKHLKDTREWIGTWCSSDTNKLSPCFEGLHQTLIAIEALWTGMKGKKNYSIVLSHLNMDNLSKFFSIVRRKCRPNERNPSVRMVLESLKDVLFFNDPSEFKNCLLTCPKYMVSAADVEEVKNEDRRDEKSFLRETEADHVIDLKMVYTLQKKLIINKETDIGNEDIDEFDVHNYPDDENNPIELDEEDMDMPTERSSEPNTDPCKDNIPSEAKNDLAKSLAIQLKERLKHCKECCQYLFDEKKSETSPSTSKSAELINPSGIFKETLFKVQKIFEKDFVKYQIINDISHTWASDVKKQISDSLTTHCSEEEHKNEIVKFIFSGLILLTIESTNNELNNDSSVKCS